MFSSVPYFLCICQKKKDKHVIRNEVGSCLSKKSVLTKKPIASNISIIINIWELQVCLCSWLCLYIMESHSKFQNIMTLNADIFNSQEDPNNSMKWHIDNKMKIKIHNMLQALEIRHNKLDGTMLYWWTFQDMKI